MQISLVFKVKKMWTIEYNSISIDSYYEGKVTKI